MADLRNLLGEPRQYGADNRQEEYVGGRNWSEAGLECHSKPGDQHGELATRD